ncbi:hypothetical protein [Enhydrobacter aerosaccus]|uniref:hypothetical protein n=1 Tax=Enhydrobacter aerosaccus TaxID=225324 RepID=UPI000A2EDF76|nr:hypothetical protein [Enhydrobacter aerosaccus]
MANIHFLVSTRRRARATRLARWPPGLDVHALKRVVEAGAPLQLIDVRSRDEVAEGLIPGARPI